MNWISNWICFSFCVFVLSCVFAQEQPIALIGTILLPGKSIRNGTLIIRNKHIEAVGNNIPIPDNSITYYTSGVIAPGLIDLHNHLIWNVFRRWKPNEEFGSRYDWQQKPIYRTSMAAPQSALVREGLSCAMQRYAEVKAITQGATSVTGSLRQPCNRGLARNLDDDSTLGKVLYNVFPLEMSEVELKRVKATLSDNGTLLIHLSEGSPTDANAERESSMLRARGLLVPGVSLIHGVALKEQDFREMGDNRVGLIWSPRSNLELYGSTVDLEAAIRNRVTVALAPDWSPTGSDGLISEMNFAAAWNAGLSNRIVNDSLLFEMATINAAKLVRLENRLGLLNTGFLADILVVSTSNDPTEQESFSAITHAMPEDVSLVFIDGKAVYGDSIAMKTLAPRDKLEDLEICGVKKSISFSSMIGPQTSFKETQALLNKALRRWGRSLAPLSECGTRRR